MGIDAMGQALPLVRLRRGRALPARVVPCLPAPYALLDEAREMVRLARLGHWLSGRYVECVEPALYGLRASRRLRDFGYGETHALALASLDLAGDGTGCTPQCMGWIERYLRYYRRFVHVHHGGSSPWIGRGHVALLDLGEYDGYEGYVLRQRRLAGNFYRDAVKAGKKGYVCRGFRPQDHVTELLAIRRSMRVRSFGIVLDAFTLKRDDLLGELALRRQWRESPCLKHWERWRGVFLQDSSQVSGLPSEKGMLVAYAVIHRIGNVVRYADFMGHGAHLRQGVMMVLHHDVVAWLFDEGNSLAKGVRYLSYGAIEQGGAGLAFWKRKALFRPHALAIEPI